MVPNGRRRGPPSPTSEVNADPAPPPEFPELRLKVPAAEEVEAPPMGVAEFDDHLFERRDGRMGRA